MSSLLRSVPDSDWASWAMLSAWAEMWAAMDEVDGWVDAIANVWAGMEAVLELRAITNNSASRKR